MSNPDNKGISKKGTKNSNVVSIFTGKQIVESANPIIRIAPELDGMEMLYSNNAHSDKLYTLKVCCWALRANGDVHAMVPWLNKLVSCMDLQDPLDGQWQGYRDPKQNRIFYQAPEHKTAELKAAADYFGSDGKNRICTQEIPDSIGTHAALTSNGFKTLTLIEVHSWKLNKDGIVSGLVVDYSQTQTSPVLKGDRALIDTHSHPDFKYFFQHSMANKIKNQDPEALAAISLLIEAH